MKHLSSISLILISLGVCSLINYHAQAQAPSWQLKCQYEFSQTYGSDNHMYDFDANNEMNGVIINNSDFLRRTSDGGNTWTEGVSQPLFSLKAIKYVGTNQIIFAGASKIHRSTNGGVTFTQINNQHPQAEPYSIDGKGNFILMGCDAHYVCVSTDGGSTWSSQRLITKAQPLRTAVIISPSVAFVASSAHVFRTTDGGATWAQPTMPADFNASMLSFSAGTENNWVVAYRDNNQQQKLYKTTNAGAEWVDISEKLPKTGAPPRPKQLDRVFTTADGKIFGVITNESQNVYSGDFAATNFVNDPVQTGFTMNERYFKTIGNKVYQLVRFSNNGNTAFRIYTTEYQGAVGVKPVHHQHMQFNIYPNPLSGSKLHLSGLPARADVYITDGLGKKILTQTMCSEDADLTLPYQLKPGVYWVKVVDGMHFNTKCLVVTQ